MYKKIRDGRVTYSAYSTFLLKIGTASTGTKELKNVFDGEKVFDTPKPESLISHLIYLVTNENDIILDSFVGSGTTPAVAHKMKRKWISIELMEHCYSVTFPRLQKVVDGSDQGGISKAVNWKGGGGFKFYELAPSLLNQDKFGNWIISKEYNANMLAAAMAKQEGFKYQPDSEKYWKQGKSSEADFIYTTTQFVTAELLDRIADELSDGESLLICAKKFQQGLENTHTNISLKKIPQMLLGKCEFGKDDYKLNIIDLPKIDTDDCDFDEEEDNE